MLGLQSASVAFAFLLWIEQASSPGGNPEVAVFFGLIFGILATIVAGLAVLVFLLCLIALYCLPILVAYGRRSPLLPPIIVVNLLLGFSWAGWVIALAMAVWPVADAVDGERGSASAGSWRRPGSAAGETSAPREDYWGEDLSPELGLDD